MSNLKKLGFELCSKDDEGWIEFPKSPEYVEASRLLREHIISLPIPDDSFQRLVELVLEYHNEAVAAGVDFGVKLTKDLIQDGTTFDDDTNDDGYLS